MLNCPNCGYEIFEESKFCSACGSPVNAKKLEADYQPNSVEGYDPFSKDPFETPVQQHSRFSQPDQSGQSTFNSRQNSYNLFEQSYRPPVSRIKRENHIVFIFVTTLILVIEFGYGCISLLPGIIALPDVSAVNAVARNLYNFVILSYGTVVIAFLPVLVCFILAAVSMNQKKMLEKRISTARILFIISIAVFLLIATYVVSEILVLVETNKVLEVQQLTMKFDTEIIRGLIFDSVFLILSFVNIFEAKMFIDELEKKLRKKNDSAV